MDPVVAGQANGHSSGYGALNLLQQANLQQPPMQAAASEANPSWIQSVDAANHNILFYQNQGPQQDWSRAADRCVCLSHLSSAIPVSVPCVS